MPITNLQLSQMKNFCHIVPANGTSRSVSTGIQYSIFNIQLKDGLDPSSQTKDRTRLLFPNAGVHVSPIQLGAMSIGDKSYGHL